MKLRGQYETALTPADACPEGLRWTRPLNSAAARRLRVSFDPSDIGIEWGVLFLRCRSHAVTMAAQVVDLACLLAVFSPYRLNGSLYSACFFPRSGVTAKPIDRVKQDAAPA